MKRFWVSLLALLLVGALFATGMAEGLEAVGDDYEQETDDSYDSSEDAFYEEEAEEQDEFLIGGDETESEMASGYADFVWDTDDPNGDFAVSAPEAQSGSDSADFVIEDGVLVDYVGTGGDVVIPDGVTIIRNFVFQDNIYVTSVRIPNSVTSIGEGAFSGCEALSSVTIPNSVKSIGNWAFSNCKSLTRISIPNSVQIIGERAFYECISLTNVTIPNSVANIGEAAFLGCVSLTSVTIPSSIKTIARGVFNDCESLTSVRIPNSVTSIGPYAFLQCISLSNVLIPGSVKTINEGAFMDCPSLKDVTITGDNISIDDTAFDYGPAFHVRCNTELIKWVTENGFSVKTVHSVETTTVKGKAATYVATGLTDGSKCSVCGEWITPQKEIARKVYPGSNLKKKGKNGTITAYIGTPFTLTPTFATNAKVTVKKYKSSKAKFATVTSAGLVTPKKAGTTTITVTTANKKVKATVKIKVVAPPPESIAIKNKGPITLKKGKAVTLKTALTPKYAASGLKWTSSDKSIATVDKKGKVKAKKPGAVTITVTSTKNKNAKATITVNVVK